MPILMSLLLRKPYLFISDRLNGQPLMYRSLSYDDQMPYLLSSQRSPTSSMHQPFTNAFSSDKFEHHYTSNQEQPEINDSVHQLGNNNMYYFSAPPYSQPVPTQQPFTQVPPGPPPAPGPPPGWC